MELRNVLVVDDQPPVVKAIASMFAPLGVNVHGAHSAEDARQLSNAVQPELAIVDIFLKGGDARSGLDVMVELRERTPHLVIAAISGRMTTRLEAECVAAGADWTLEKPFNRATLLDALLTGRVPVPTMLRVDLPLDKIKNLYVTRVIEAESGNKSAAARVLGKRRTTLQRMVRRADDDGLPEPPRDDGDDEPSD